MPDHNELHDDDKPIGRILSRREALTLFGGASAAALSGLAMMGSAVEQALTATPSGSAMAGEIGTPIPTPSAVPDCVVVPALTEGPYFVDEQLERVDLRADEANQIVKEGLLLKLTFRVSDVTGGTCGPLTGAQVDLWHCDALGEYSGVTDTAEGFDTTDQMWLRGYQLTDENGLAQFVTIYPGWYSGRAVHMHFKIRTDPDSETGYEFTSQLFFPEEITDIVHAMEPYNQKGYRDVLNEEDNIFQGSDGVLTLKLVELGEKEEEDAGEPGYSALFDIGLDLEAEPVEQGGMGGPGGSGERGTPPPRP